MDSLGFHLILDRDDAKLLFGRREPDALRELLEKDLLPRLADEDRLKLGNWRLLHRLLGDGTMAPDGGEYPLNQCYLGSRPLDAGPECVVRMIRPDTVGHVAAALAELDPDAPQTRLETLPAEYAGPRDDNILAAVQSALADLQRLFQDAAARQCAVVFYANETT